MFVISLVKINTSVEVNISHFDKIVHVGLYFIGTLVWFMHFVKVANQHTFKASILKAVAVAFVMGVVIEFLQELNPNARSGDVKDVIANTIGILIAVLFVSQIRKYHALNSVK